MKINAELKSQKQQHETKRDHVDAEQFRHHHEEMVQSVVAFAPSTTRDVTVASRFDW